MTPTTLKACVLLDTMDLVADDESVPYGLLAADAASFGATVNLDAPPSLFFAKDGLILAYVAMSERMETSRILAIAGDFIPPDPSWVSKLTIAELLPAVTSFLSEELTKAEGPGSPQVLARPFENDTHLLAYVAGADQTPALC